ncbi:eukaryotic translation initiation factor 4B3-like [Iris pallida]|uniref:Eukaryotic translation initiation factor 4B3-like n=1 Tax=Iris pallida TaxID=29817 RepID=A0AAX6HSZ0_IRIPA|nr:eukaryotic translation initiation factor 4B3-like [Iris pallida]
MAAVSAWAKPGAWALDSEEQEAAMEHQNQQPNSAAAADFPSLAAAKTAKKKKKQTFSLAEFSSGAAEAKFQPSSRSSASAVAAGETLVLPTGPRERSAEELERPRGFGYSSYGEGRESRSREPREPREPRDSGPSRADEVDDWGSMKRSVVPERRERERGGGFFDSQQQSSRADDSDSWISRKPVGSGPPPRTNGGGRGGFDMLNREGSNALGGADSDTWGKKREDVGPVGGGGAGGRPRLVLQPRSLPVAANGSNGEAPAAPAPVEGKTKGSNPFGEARPREEVLKEKGKDWKEIDEKLEAVKIQEAPVERKGFGSGNGRPREDRTERAWRKPDVAVAAPPLLERAENVEQLPEN